MVQWWWWWRQWWWWWMKLSLPLTLLSSLSPFVFLAKVKESPFFSRERMTIFSFYQTKLSALSTLQHLFDIVGKTYVVVVRRNIKAKTRNFRHPRIVLYIVICLLCFWLVDRCMWCSDSHSNWVDLMPKLNIVCEYAHCTFILTLKFPNRRCSSSSRKKSAVYTGNLAWTSAIEQEKSLIWSEIK